MFNEDILTGIYKHKIDHKNRVIIPIKFMPSDGEKLYLIPTCEDDTIILTAYNQIDYLGFEVLRASMVPVNVDSQKRILIPGVFAEDLKQDETNQVYFIGNVNHALITTQDGFLRYVDEHNYDVDPVNLKLKPRKNEFKMGFQGE